MSIHNKKVVTVEITVNRYKTTDGRIFEEKEKASIQQDIIDGIKKECPKCLGYGKLQESDADGWHSYEVKCPKCNGKGYLERKENWI